MASELQTIREENAELYSHNGLLQIAARLRPGGVAVYWATERNARFEAVLADGQVIQTGGKLVKTSSGYDLTQLLIGSEGTLAVVTKIILKLLPRPQYRSTLLVAFTSIDAKE